MNRNILAGFLSSIACVLLGGCFLFGGSAEVEDWWNNPPANPAIFVGVSPVADVQLRRVAAESDARAKAASYVQTTIQQLITNWATEAVKQSGQATVARNVEAVTREFVNQTVRGCRSVKYYYDESAGVQYVMVIIGDPKELAGQMFGGRDLLVDETLLQTGVLKQAALKKLDEMIAAQAEETAKNREAALRLYGGAGARGDK